jgi:hypothetical protein
MKHTVSYNHHRIEFEQECPTCEGTGIFAGLAERDGFGVQCYECKGAGVQTTVVEWDEFTGRKPRADIVTVIEVNPGIVLGLQGANGKTWRHDSFGGMPYNDWFQGAPFPDKSENREFTCPAWWYQSADYSKKPKGCPVALAFTQCPKYGDRSECWAKFDRKSTAAAT